MIGSRRAGRGVGVGLVLLFAVAACGGGEDETAPVVVRSADGVVTVTAASGASPDISITAVTELPELLAEAEAEGLQVIQYELGPDGQEFEEPVRIEFRLHHESLGLDVGVLPVASVVGREKSGGRWFRGRRLGTLTSMSNQRALPERPVVADLATTRKRALSCQAGSLGHAGCGSPSRRSTPDEGSRLATVTCNPTS